MTNEKDLESLIKMISLKDSQVILKDIYKAGVKQKFQISLNGNKKNELIAKNIDAVNIGNSGLSKGYLVFLQEDGNYQLAMQDKSVMRAGWIVADDKTRTIYINLSRPKDTRKK